MFDAILENLPYLLGGFLTNVQLAVFALGGGLFLGALVGLGRISERPWVYHPVTVYVNFLRNIPLILVIFWFYFVMPILVGRTMDPFVSAAVSFIVFEATYFGEIFAAQTPISSQSRHRVASRRFFQAAGCQSYR